MSTFKVFRSTVVALAMLSTVYMTVQSSDPCHLREFDLCMASAVVFIQQPQGVKISEELIDKQCDLFKETEDCIDKFKETCMTRSQYQLIDFATGGILNVMKNYCKKGSEMRRNFLKHGDCVQKQRKNSNRCLKDFQAAIEKSTVDSTHWKDRPKVLCCALDRYHDCLKSVIEPACGPEGLKVAENLVRGTFSRAADTSCKKYKHTSAQCLGLMPPVGTEPLGARSKSVMSKLISTYTT